jgi:hypothetical protein
MNKGTSCSPRVLIGRSDNDSDAPSGGVGEVSQGSSENDIMDGTGLNDLFLDGRGGDDMVGYGGNDILVGEFGSDTLFGCAGVDDFAVQHFRGDDALTIGDFDPDTETLTLIQPNPATAVIAFQPDGMPGTQVLVDGQATAYVLGCSAAELAANGSPWLFLEQS